MSVERQPGSAGDSDNVRIVKRVFDAFARRDVGSALEVVDPQVRLWLVTSAVTREGRPYVGHDGIREYLGDADRVWHGLELRPLEFDEIGDAVVVLGEVRARGPAGPLRQPAVWTWKVLDGRVIDCRVDSDLRAARQALGESKAIEDLVGAFVAAFNRRDAEAMIALADPTIVVRPASIFRVRSQFVGHEGLRNWIRGVLIDDPGFTVATDEIRKLEEDRWAVLGKLVDNEAPVSPFASLVGVADGLVMTASEYLSEDSMLRELR